MPTMQRPQPAHGQPLAGFPNLHVTHEPLDLQQGPPYPSSLPSSRVHKSPIQGGIKDAHKIKDEQDQQKTNQLLVEDPKKGLQLENLDVEIQTAMEQGKCKHPIEGRPDQTEKKVAWSDTVAEQQKNKREDKTQAIPIQFATKKLPLAKELSHKRSKRKKKLKTKFSPHRSTRNSRHVNSLRAMDPHRRMESVIKVLLGMVVILWSTMPIWGETKVEFLDE